MNIHAHRTLLPLAASLALGLVAQQAAAATISTSVSFPAVSESDLYSQVPPFTLPPGTAYFDAPAAGLAQFDPANGTLTGIEMGLHIESYDMTLSLANRGNIGSRGQFESAVLWIQISISAVLPSGRAAVFSSALPAGLIYDEYDTVSIAAEMDAPILEDALAALDTWQIPASDFLSSFIGTGDVSILSLGIYTFDFLETITLSDGRMVAGLTNIDSATIGPFTMSIHYTYTPAVVPLPAGVWLLGSALLGLAGIRRRMA